MGGEWEGQAGQQSRARRPLDPAAGAGGPAGSGPLVLGAGPSSLLPRYTAALLTLHASALRYTATFTRSPPRTASFPIPCPLFNSELVASDPARHACLSL